MSEEFAIIIKLQKFATDEFVTSIFDDERKHNGKYIIFIAVNELEFEFVWWSALFLQIMKLFVNNEHFRR